MKKAFLFMLMATLALADGVMVGSAGGYKKPLLQIVELAKSKGINIDPTFGHPKQMIAQVVAGGKDYGIIIGDDIFLKNQKEVKIKNFETLGEGLLVFVSNKNISNLDDLSDLKIAYAQPKKTIYGKCAFEALSNLKTKPKESLEVGFVAQVSTYVKNGDVDGGFINLTEAIAQRGNFKSEILVDKTLYNVPNIVAAELNSCKKNDNCQKFLHLLKSEEAKKIFKSYGL